MTREQFDQAILSLRSMLYYVSYGLLANSNDQDDAVQEAIRKALEKRASLRDEKQFKSWLTRIVINECYNILRKRKREIPTEELPALEVPPQAKEELFDALMTLEVKRRLPIVLHYYEGYTTKEIAQILRVPEGTIKGRLVRAREQLGLLLQEKEALA